MNEQLWWYVSRSGGIVAWLVAGLAILVGLAMPSRIRSDGIGRPWLLDLHRFLGGLTFAFLGLHLLGLWADSFFDFGLVELLVPFTSPYRPSAVAWGVVAFWLLVAIEVSSLIRHRIPRRMWRSIHFGSYLVFAFGARHAVVAGSDTENLFFRGFGAVLIAAVLGGTAARIDVERGRKRQAARRSVARRPVVNSAA